MIKNNNVCNNCSKQGHQFHQCKLPIISYGIVLFRSSNIGIQYLMIRRRNTFGYIDFMRGKYTHNNLEHLQLLFNEMSIEERHNIKNYDFDTLWKLMWSIEGDNEVIFKGEELISQKKFEALKTGITIANKLITLDCLIEHSITKWNETEWEFPKGRRNYQEKDLDCALREFEEETGLPKKDIKIIENLMPFEEIFIGSNHKSYKHKYYLGYIDYIDDKVDAYQKTEVSKIEWKTLQGCLESIRPYNTEKIQLINNINKVLKEYRLF